MKIAGRFSFCAMLCLSLLLSGGAWAAQTTPPLDESAPRVKVDRIEIEGVTVFAQQQIENSMEVSPGDRLERVKVVRTAENLQALYRARGFERVSIESRLLRRKNEQGILESILEFSVVEGEPTRIASIRFVPERIRDDSFNRYWKGLEARLLSRVELAPGELLDQEKLTAARRVLQDVLAAEEFIGAKAEDMRVSSAQPPANLASMKLKGGVARWVGVDFHIDLGERVSFGFRGNQVFPLSRLNVLVDEQKALGFATDYVGAIRSRIEELYRAEGYAKVQVKPYTFDYPERQERHVTYDIIEGPRVRLDLIDFEGNIVFSDAELREQFFKRASVLLQNGYYVEKDVQKAVELVIEWMKSKGYLGSKLVTINTAPSPRGKRAGPQPVFFGIVVSLYEGEQTRLRGARFEGLTVFPRTEVEKLLGLKEGEPLNLYSFGEGLEALKAAYRVRGYFSFRIVNEGTEEVVRYSDENRSAEVMLEFSEGIQFKTGTILIEGLSLTKEYVVRREVLCKPGEMLSETDLYQTEANLRRLGIFSFVSVALADDPEKPDHKIVKISLQEGTPGVVAGGPGFRNDLGIRLFGQLAYTNLWGMNHTLSLTATANRRINNSILNNSTLIEYRFVEYQAQLSYLYPWFLLDEMTFRPTFTVSGTEYIKFDATTVSVAATWEKRLWRDPNITAIFTYSLERVNQFNARAAEDNRGLRIGAIIPTLRLDTRDSQLNPTTGWFGLLSYEFAAPWLLSQTNPYPVGYTRTQGRLDRMIQLSRSVSWYLSFRGGFERSTEEPTDEPGSGAIPLIKQFSLGGAGSLRGFAEQQLNVQELAIKGTLSYANYRTQLDLPLMGALHFGPFLDAANLLVDNHSIGQYFFEGLRYGAGFGFHYQTPVGPVNLDLGFNLAPKPGEERSRIYFSIGVI